MIHFWGADFVSHGFWRQNFGSASAEERRDFGSLISNYYRYLDEAIGRLETAAGPGALTIVLSDHGFQAWTPPPGDSHPQLSGNHRPDAVLILAGPRVKSGENLDGTLPVDIAPTVRRYLDIPPAVGESGHALVNAFVAQGLPAPRPPRPQTRRPAPTVRSELSREEADRLRALGYLR
jgi:predicted AlkP superfamily phosphohydrolase/phosphomutase